MSNAQVPAKAPILVEAHGVFASYGDAARRVPVIADAAFHVERGKVTAIVGRSGSGKTTLLNLLGALERPDQGRIAVDGADLAQMTRQELSAFRRTEVGFVFQSFHLLPTLSARENVEAGLEPLRISRAAVRERAEAALAAVGLGAKFDRFPHQMSGGEQQRVAVARACAKDPPLLLADEPTGNLDEEDAGPVLDLIVGQAGIGTTPRTVVIVTHDKQIASRADDVLQVHAHQVHRAG